MGTYTLETQRGKRLTIESDSPENAMRLADRWDLEDHAASEAKRLGVNPDLILRQMQRESGGNERAVSPKGARGPMQLMPGTAKDLGVDPDDPYQNVTGGVTYMKRQLDTFGGDERKALAAYNAGPEAVQRAGGVPNYPETRAYVDALSPEGGQEVYRAPGLSAERVSPGPLPGALPKPNAMPAAAGRRDQMLGFGKGAFTPVDHASHWLENAIRGTGAEAPLSQVGAGLRGMLPKGVVSFIDNPQGFYDAKAKKGVLPGKIGEFAGNVASTAWVPGGPLVQGAVSGALLSDKKGLGGVVGDAALGGAVGRLTALGSDALQVGARKLLSKAPKVPGVEELGTLAKDAWQQVDGAGIRVTTQNARQAVANLDAYLAKKGWTDAKIPELDRLRNLAKQKGGIMLSQLNDLYSDAYTALVKPGGRESLVGTRLRDEINRVIDTEAGASALVRTARDLTSRFKKADYVTRAAGSADLAAERTYGGDFGRKVKDRIAPLVDPLKKQSNFRGATPDEMAALNKVARGTKTQNLASALGGMTDPRRMGGKVLAGVLGGLSGGAGVATGGASLPATLALQGGQVLAGLGLTAKSSAIARKNVDELIRLIAVGGSKQVLGGATKASYAAEKAIAALRPALVAASVPALAAARPRPKKK